MVGTSSYRVDTVEEKDYPSDSSDWTRQTQLPKSSCTLVWLCVEKAALAGPNRAMELQTCAVCYKRKPETDFCWRFKSKGIRQGKCKECHKEYLRGHYQRNKAMYLDAAKRTSEKMMAFLREQKDRPCTDCGVKYPHYVMDFDHLGDKSFTLGGSGRRYGIGKLKAEIAKCEVVCSNCHRERTMSRLGPVAQMDRAPVF